MQPYKLIIVESPSKAHTIGKYLGSGYKVEASQGHLRDLPKSQLGVDIEAGFEPKYITIRGRGEIISTIRKEAKAATKVLLATDPDREGEAIAWHLAVLLGIDPNSACRIEFNEVTSSAVKAAVKQPRSIKTGLFNAQQARRVLDRLVGYKLSPLLWSKVRKGLSAGRVQSVATALVVEREQEINDFIPEEYWTVDAAFKCGKVSFPAAFYAKDGQKLELKNEKEALEIVEAAKKRVFCVSSVQKGERRKYPAPPFTTSTLQQEASRKLNFTASKTMQIAQQLYEGVDVEGEGTLGLITYLRTDSTRISDEATAAVREYISRNYAPEYLPEAPNIYKSRSGAQDAHEAIRPTVLKLTPVSVKGSLTNDQYKLYKLVYERFVSCQMTPAVYDTMESLIDGSGLSFRHASQKKRFAGFTCVYEEGQDDQTEDASGKMPALSEGMKLELDTIKSEQHFTTPPARYTEAALVRTLEELGIGRPSTYAPTISTILTRGYVAREKKRLFPTELGTVVTELMNSSFPDIVDTAFTADMETRLDEVEAGEREWKQVIADFYETFERELTAAEASVEKVKIEDEVSDVPCDKCGALMVYKRSRYGRFLACPNFPACRNTQPLFTYIDAPCPKCGARLIERINKKGRKFYGCEKFPECDFISWDRPVKEKCPVCGGMMVYNRSSKGVVTHVCVNPECRMRVEAEPDGDANE